MERPSYDELISAYVDDETTPEENVVVERLLADPKYRQILDEYRQLRDDLRSIPAPRLDSEWSARLKQRIVAAKPPWAAKHDAASSPSASSGEAPLHADASGPMPASLDATRSDGYRRFRQLWLTAGVGVAAGTLGIVIGWSAQNLTPREFALDHGSDSVASPALPSDPLPRSMERGIDPENDLLRTKAESRFALEREEVEATQGASIDFAAASSEGAAPGGGASAGDEAGAGSRAMFGSELGESAGVANVPQTVRSEAIPAAGGSSFGERLAADESPESKRAEKQSDVREGGIPGVRLSMGSPSPARPEIEEPARDKWLDAGVPTYYATYVGVWNSTGDSVTPDRSRGLAQANDEADPVRRNAAFADGGVVDDSLKEVDSPAPALVLEGSPERVAEALEILSRDRSRGEVRLMERSADSSAFAYDLRARQLSERSVESVLDVKGDGEASDAPIDSMSESLAFGMKDSAATSAIDRIEAFFDDETEDLDRTAGAGPSGEVLAGGAAIGGFGGGGGRSTGVVGGIGGRTLSKEGASDPALASMPGIAGADPPASAADAYSAPAEQPSVARSAVPMADAPAASPAPIASVERAPGSIPLTEPAAPLTRGPDPLRNEAAGAASAMPPAPAMAPEPAPPAPAPATAFAENDTPPPPAAAAAPADASNSEEEDRSIAKSNRAVEGTDRNSMKLARGAPREGEPGAELASPAAPAASSASGVRGQATTAGTLAIEQLQEEAGSSRIVDRSSLTREFAAPAPQRVRVILYASDRPLSRATLVPAGPAEALPGEPTPASEP